MKRLAILTGGPSLTEMWSDDLATGYDTVIAVNGACYFFESDYVALVDRCVWLALNDGTARWPRRGFFTHANWPVPKDRERHPLPLYDRTLGRVPKKLADEQGVTECGYTFPSALLAAQDMADGGPVHIYGFDYSPEGSLPADPAVGAGRWVRELPWVKHAWGPNVTAYGRAHPNVLAWLKGEGSFEAMQTLLFAQEAKA